MTVVAAQMGVVDESTYGTPVTVTRFFEFNDESINLDVARIESGAVRASTRVLRNDRYAIDRVGAAGSIEMEVHSKGFGWWLKHMLGAVSTGSVVDETYTHTGTIATLLGDYFTLQLSRPFNPSGTAQAFTYHGGKVASWELSNSVGGLLMFSAELDFEDEDTSTALATASYPASTELMSFVGGTVTIGGSSVDVIDATVSCDNNLKTDRRFVRGSSLKKEPVEAGLRDIEFSLEVEFDALTQYNRFAATTVSDTLAEIVLTWEAPSVVGAGSTKPRLQVTIPAARFDRPDGPNVSGHDPLTLTLNGKGLFNGTDSAITVAYRSADSTA